jgi:LDH2 family malate/lactate/ureidoglycolate dehydrogenase
MEKPVNIPKDVLSAYGSELLVNRGVVREDAETAMDAYLTADLRGVESHGILRFATYIKRIDMGLMQATNNIRIITESDSFCVIDGGNYLGPVIGVLAMEKAIAKAEKNTIAISLVQNSSHLGMCAYYAMMPLPHDMIGFVTTNAAPLMAPTGGKKPIIGNNPFAFAAPAGEHLPVVLDIAVSQVAAGKVLFYKETGRSIPPGWCLDKEGNPTEDATAGHYSNGGMLLPMGGHKGYGMAIMFDILAGVLTGSAFGDKILTLLDFETQRPSGAGHFMMAINIAHIMDPTYFKSRLDSLIDEIKSCPRADGIEEIYLPGELEFACEKQRKIEGIPITPQTLNELNQLGMAIGMNPLS